MQRQYKIVIVIVMVVVAGAFGRYTAPVRVKIETKTVEVIKEVRVKDTNEVKKKNKIYKKVVDISPTGASVSTTTITEVDSTVDKIESKTLNDTSIAKTETKEVTKNNSRLNLSFLAGVNTTAPGNGMLYGGHVTKDIFGPLNIGIWGLSNGAAGCSIGVSF